MFSLRFGSGGLPWRPRNSSQRARRTRAASGEAPTASGQRIGGFGGVAQAGVMAGAAAGLGSLAVQFVDGQVKGVTPDFDLQRAARMAGFGALLFGPYQHLWLSLMDWAMPAKTLANGLAKTALSQVGLAPAVLAFLYAWNLAGEGVGRPTAYSKKVQRELQPGTVCGWRMWLPAAGVNFLVMPPGLQVLFLTAFTSAWASRVSPADPDASTWSPREIVMAPITAAKEAPAPAPAPAAAAAPAKAKSDGFSLDDKRVTLAAVALWIAACVALKKD
ncbi:MAG: hypothetical protein J3K34DRAFT_459325 [Monoraphidium minutum]|nr:MAG: hypothetical protein J3K34DRAFT_459325 [Monoraphidium minutum]